MILPKWVGEGVLAHYLVRVWIVVRVWIGLLRDSASELDMYNVFQYARS
jgi:hypothetical protein